MCAGIVRKAVLFIYLQAYFGDILLKRKMEGFCNAVYKLVKRGKYDDVKNIFEKLKTDEERVIYVFNIMWENDLAFSVGHRPKNAEESEKLRLEGNCVFSILGHIPDNTLCRKALSLYTKSIAFAPHTSGQLPLAYANRSAVLFELGLYSECVQDIDRALNLMYPDRLRGKLYLRKTKCLIILRDHTAKSIIGKARYWINKMTQDSKKLKLQVELDILCQKIEQTNIQKDSVKLEKSESDPALPVIKSYNKEIPCASDAVAVEYDAYSGRHVVATRDINVGEVLVVEKPYSFLLAQENILEYCSNCLRECWAPVTCEYCTCAMYCSEQCKDIEWSKCHDVECAVLPIMVEHGFSNTDLLSLRLVVLAVKEAGNIQGLRTMLKEVDKSDDPMTRSFWPDGKFHSDKYTSVYNLERNTKKRSFSDLFDKVERACFMSYVLAKYTVFFGAKISGDLKVLMTNENVTFLGGLILRNQQAVDINARNFYEVRNGTVAVRGLAVTAFCSLFNHSCHANVVIISRPQHIVSYAVYPVKKGEQLQCAYGVHFFRMPKLLRQQLLWEKHRFFCNCVACEENWPIGSDYKSVEAVFKTTKASDEAIVADARVKFKKCYCIVTRGDVVNNPHIIEDLLVIIKILYDRVPIHSPMLSFVVEILKLAYRRYGNKFVLPTMQTRDI